MKIYVIVEGHTDKIIRGVTLNQDIAARICRAFSHLGLFFIECEAIDSEEEWK